MPVTVELDIDDFLEDGWAMPSELTDAKEYLAFAAERCDAKNIGKPLLEGLNAAQRSRVASKSYRKAWTVGMGAVVAGNAVYISADNTLAKADATTAAKAAAIGFARYVDGTTCYIDHFVLVTTLSGGTRNQPVYLKDDGTFGAAAGTVPKVIGYFLSATSAYLFLNPITSLGGSSGLETLVAHAADAALTAADAGKIHSNAGAAGTVTLTLPALLAGLKFTFYKSDNQTFRINAGALNLFKFADLTNASTNYFTLIPQYGTCEIFCDGTYWIVKYGQTDLE